MPVKLLCEQDIVTAVEAEAAASHPSQSEKPLSSALDDLRPLDCVLTERDHSILNGRLQELLGYGEGVFPLLSRYLLAKLDDARIVETAKVSRDIATGNSRVIYALDAGHEDSRVLVHSHNYFVAGFSLPITSFLGLAILGAGAGQRLPYLEADGTLRQVLLKEVAYQPESSFAERG